MKQVERTQQKCGKKESIEKRGAVIFVVNSQHVDRDKIMKQNESQLVNCQ